MLNGKPLKLIGSNRHQDTNHHLGEMKKNSRNNYEMGHPKPCQLIPLRWFPILFALTLFVNACATLQPVQLPDEYTNAPSEAPLWQSLMPD